MLSASELSGYRAVGHLFTSCLFTTQETSGEDKPAGEIDKPATSRRFAQQYGSPTCCYQWDRENGRLQPRQVWSPGVSGPHPTAGTAGEITLTDAGSATQAEPGVPAPPPPAPGSHGLPGSLAITDLKGRHSWFKSWFHCAPSEGHCEKYEHDATCKGPSRDSVHLRHLSRSF